MTRIAVRDSSDWISVDPWEPLHKEYLPTVKVLDHFEHELNDVMGGIETASGEKRRVHVALLAGADLIQTMSTPGLWAQEDLKRILGHYGAFILERSGTDIGKSLNILYWVQRLIDPTQDDALASLQQYRDKIHIMQQLIQNDVSSTKIRLFRKRGMSIRYLIPDNVVRYIDAHDLYRDERKVAATEKGKERASDNSSSDSEFPSSST